MTLAAQMAVRWAGPALHESAGSVLVADQIVSVEGVDREQALRILGSARPAGDPAPGVTTFSTVTVPGSEGATFETPDGIAVTVDVVAPGSCETNTTADRTPDRRWQLCTEAGYQVSAPTQALAQLVAATIGQERSAYGSTWPLVEADDIALRLPPGWEIEFIGKCGRRFGPADATGSGGPAVDVSGCGQIPPGSPGTGWVAVGDAYVTVRNTEPADARRILASVAPAGTPSPDVALWSRADLGDGVTAEVPAEWPGVEVELWESLASCAADPRGPAEDIGDERWRTGVCGTRYVSVTGPTQALTDVVASLVRGY